MLHVGGFRIVHNDAANGMAPQSMHAFAKSCLETRQWGRAHKKLRVGLGAVAEASSAWMPSQKSHTACLRPTVVPKGNAIFKLMSVDWLYGGQNSGAEPPFGLHPARENNTAQHVSHRPTREHAFVNFGSLRVQSTQVRPLHRGSTETRQALGGAPHR